MSKKATPQLEQTIKVPQTDGQAGWLILQRTSASYIVRSQMSPKQVSYVIDERCFDDTIFRVEKTKDAIYIADVYVWQGVLVFETKSFSEREQLCRDFLKYLYTSCSAFEWLPLKLRSDFSGAIKGYEYYSDCPGDIGSFSEDMRTSYTIHKTNIPDLYTLEDESGYVDVPTIEVSKKLLQMGDVFQLFCKKSIEDPELWEIIAFQ